MRSRLSAHGPRRLLLAGVAIVLFSVLAGAQIMMFSKQPAATAATENTASEVRVLSGGIHTVHHSLGPLPTAAAPRADGLPTLVWFGATWCDVCHAMEGVMANVQTDTRGHIVLVEKDVDAEPSLARQFLVRGTPTFVVLDALGRELGRVPAAFDTRQFEADLQRVVARAT